MKTEDWQQIEDLFHEALNVEAGDRSAYLMSACNGDESLRLEVESLLKAFEHEHSFMEQPAMSLGMKILSGGVAEELIGKTIGSYKIVRQLGRGGMGEVYLAEDGKLNRNVALKFFTSHHTDNVWMRRQLTKEARAVASLEHPNICAVYGIEQADGYDFIVMQYIEGETLDSLMANGPLELNKILELSDQIISALAAAHSHGIIHRDIKPQNIMVTAEGQIKVLDFGLAKVVQQKQNMERAAEDQSQLSQTGLIVGTVAYMSPEQLRAEELDFRSDIFSVGILLYELISGKNPYKRKSEADTISATLTTSPSPLAHPASKIPPALNAIVHKCLEKEKERRYQSANDLLSALNKFKSESRRRFHLSRRAIAALALLLLLVVGSTFAYFRFTRVDTSTASTPNKEIHTLAVLPPINESANPKAEYLGNGLTASLVNQLSRLSRLRVIAPSSLPGHQDRNLDLQKIGRDLKVDAVLVERIKERDGLLMFQTTLVSSANGATLWEDEYDILVAEIQTLPQVISEKIVLTLQLQVNEDDKQFLTKAQTDRPEAYKLYLLGRHYWSKRDKDNIKKAINYFKQATDIDPLYAQAWTGLADSYVLLNSVAYGDMPTEKAMTLARAAARKALEIDNTLCEAHTSLGVIKLRYEWQWLEAESEFKRAIELNPEYAPAHFWYSNVLSVMGREDEAIAESELARSLDPFSPLMSMNIGRAYYYAHQYDKALKQLIETLKEAPDNTKAEYVLGYVYLRMGMLQQAIQIFERFYPTQKAFAAAPLGYAYARAGRRDDALRILAELEELSKKGNISPHERAVIYIGLDDKEQAFAWLRKAYEERFFSLAYLMVDPMYDSLRADPRFADLARDMNLKPKGQG
jgi:serine/threonine-protein kinase